MESSGMMPVIIRRKISLVLCATLFTIFGLQATAAAADDGGSAVATHPIKFQRIYEALVYLSRSKPGIETYYLINGRFPNSDQEAQIASPKQERLENIESAAVGAHGVVTVKFASSPGAPDAWISYVPTYAANYIPTMGPHAANFSWRCESSIQEIEKIAPNCHPASASPEVAATTPAVPPPAPLPPAPAPARTASARRLACEVLKHSIEAKLSAHGVKNYRLEILARSATTANQIVGHCNGGSGKIRYSRGR